MTPFCTNITESSLYVTWTITWTLLWTVSSPGQSTHCFLKYILIIEVQMSIAWKGHITWHPSRVASRRFKAGLAAVPLPVSLFAPYIFPYCPCTNIGFTMISLATILHSLDTSVLETCTLHDLDYFLRVCVHFKPELELFQICATGLRISTTQPPTPLQQLLDWCSSAGQFDCF